MHAPRPTWATPAMLVVVAIWACNFIAMRFVLAELPLLVVGALRFSGAALLLLLLLQLREGSLGAPRAVWGQLILIGVVGNTIYQTLFMIGLERTSVGNTAILLATSPLQTALLGALTGIEKASARLWTGLGLAFIGAALVISDKGFSVDPETLWGDLASLGAGTCWAISTLGVKKLPTTLSPLRVTALTMLTGVPGLLLLAWPELRVQEWGVVTTLGWGSLTYSIVLSLGVAYFLWNASVAAVGPNRTAIFNCLTPLTAMLIAWPVLHEQPGPAQWAGGLFIVAGVIVGRWSPVRRLGPETA
ncbi:MAG TPA: EamA family transporter [Gemmatimonadales bacterium]|nr:EamA family transporter [Gemmatimonadales bacterium]